MRTPPEVGASKVHVPRRTREPKPDNKRRPPAFQCYASDTLADRTFALMSAAERGLMLSLRMVCWTSDFVPSDPQKIARLVGLPVDEVMAALTPDVLSFFKVDPSNAGALYDPELQAQMDRLHFLRERRAEGGRKGASSTNSRRSGGATDSTIDSATDPATDSATDSATAGRLVRREEKSGREKNRKDSPGVSIGDESINEHVEDECDAPVARVLPSSGVDSSDKSDWVEEDI